MVPWTDECYQNAQVRSYGRNLLMKLFHDARAIDMTIEGSKVFIGTKSIQ